MPNEDRAMFRRAERKSQLLLAVLLCTAIMIGLTWYSSYVLATDSH